MRKGDTRLRGCESKDRCRILQRNAKHEAGGGRVHDLQRLLKSTKERKRTLKPIKSLKATVRRKKTLKPIKRANLP